MSKQSRTVLAAVFVVAVLARIGFGVGVVGLASPQKADEADYHLLAANIADGKGYIDESGRPTARRPPGYPAFLGILYKVTDPRPAVGRIAQMILGVVLVWLVYSITRRHFDRATARVAAVFAALNPFLIFISGYALTENLYIVLLLLGIRFLPQTTADSPPVSRWFYGAVLLALASLTRPTGVPVVLWMGAALLLFGKGDWSTRIAQVTVVGLVMAALLLPWAFRNQVTFGGWVGLTTHGGITFYQGNNERVVDVPHYRGGVAPLEGLPHYDQLSRLDERARDDYAYLLGKEFVREHARMMPRIVWWKFQRLWRLQSDMGLSGIRSGWWFDNRSTPGRVAATFDAGLVYAVVAFPLFVAGLIVTRRRWREMMYFYGVIVAHTAVGLVFFGSLRTRLPIEPVIAMFAAVALVQLARRIRPGAFREA
jgi:4-amino-4-deoxy-L-arabinose transferase-like glycosyltransferase